MVQSVSAALRVVLLVVAAAFIGAQPARAQEAGVEQQLPPPDPSNPTPPSPIPVTPTEAPRFTREQAEALLVNSPAADLFDIVTLGEDHIGLRHRASGMVCRFAPDFQNRIGAVRPGSDNSDVACASGPWPATTLAAARTNLPAGAFIAAMEQEFRRDNPNSQPFQPNRFWPAPTRDAFYLHLVSTNAAGERSVIHAVAIRHDRWVIISRMTYTASGDLPIMAAELAAAAHFGSIIADLEED